MAPWLVASPAQREHQRDINRVRRGTDVAVARVVGISQVSQAAMLGTLNVAMMKREAAMLVPEDAATFDLVATQAAIAMAMQINWVAGQW